MAIILDGTTGITAPDITSAAGLDAADLTGTVASARLPAGSVIQVVTSSSGTQIRSFTQQIWIDTPFTVSITPKSVNNKILLNFTSWGLLNNNQYAGIRIIRDSTRVSQHWTYHNRDEAWNGVMNFSVSGVDVPASLTEVTYKIQIYTSYNTAAFYFNYGGADSLQMAHLTAMEVAG